MRVLLRLLGYMRPYLGRMLAASLLLGISGALMAAVISTVKPLINQVLLGKSAEPAAGQGSDILARVRDWLPLENLGEWMLDHAFVQVPLLLVGIFVFRSTLLYFGQYQTIRCGACIIRDVRVELYESVAHQSLHFYQSHSTGVILSRILNDVARLQRASTTVLADLVRVGSMVPFLLLTALVHEWRMTLLAMVALPLLSYPMVRLGRRLRKAATASQENMALVASRLAESVVAAKVVQGFGMQGYEVGRFREAVQRMLRADLRAGRAQSLGPAIMELIGAAVGGALFYAAGLFIARDELDAGDFAVVLFCVGVLFMSIRRLSALYSELQNARAAATRVFAMMDREPEILDLPGATDLPEFQRQIVFDAVDFRYEDAPVLSGIELTIERGERIALVGPSGSGKTTLANLLPRFYDPTAGRILLDGHDIREGTLASLRGQIGLVTQETVLFDDSVRDNIAYGRDDVPLERVIEVARAAYAHEFIEALPDGYDTRLGERGARLSMGQRQRLTIARALLKDSPILILDEATSALDAESEAAVQAALEKLMEGRTSLIIAHRLATVRGADRILVMERGRIVEEGTHRELLSRGGSYARLYELQFQESDS